MMISLLLLLDCSPVLYVRGHTLYSCHQFLICDAAAHVFVGHGRQHLTLLGEAEGSVHQLAGYQSFAVLRKSLRH